MKRIGKAAASIGLALALLAPASIPANEIVSSKKGEKYDQKILLRGYIVHLDKGSFSIIYENDKSAICSTNFHYEILHVKDNSKTKKIIVPHPTSYRINETVEFYYIPKSSVSIEELLYEYATEIGWAWRKPAQKGVIKIDGIIEQEDSNDKKD